MPSFNNQAQILRSLLTLETDKLYGLQDIGTSRSWDFSLPTIGAQRDITHRLNFKSDESFFDILKNDVNNGLPYQIMKDAGVFEAGNDLCLFGGCILDIILKRHHSIRDFDLRLVGESYIDDEARCVAKAKEFVASIFTTLSKENKKMDEEAEAAKSQGQRQGYVQRCNVQDVCVSRSRSTVTVHVPAFSNYSGCMFQLTFAPVKTVQDMLVACLPHCTRLAVEDGRVVLDHMARFCIESTCVVLDVPGLVNFYCGDTDDENEQAKRVSAGCTLAGQLARHIKYYKDKGFDIILPELDASKLPRRNLEYDVAEVLALPGMTVVYDKIDNNFIRATRLDISKEYKRKVPASGLIGAYDSMPEPNVGEAIHHNIRCLVNEVYDSFKYVAKGERWDDVFDWAPSLTSRMVKKSYETVIEDLEGDEIPLYRITGYFSETKPHEVVELLISKPLRDDVCQKGRLPRPFTLDQKELESLAEKEITSVVGKIEGLKETLESKGLDKLVSSFPKNVSTVDEVFDAIYGTNGMPKSKVVGEYVHVK